MTKLTLQSAFEFGIPETAEILSQGFSDYIVPIRLGFEQFVNMLRVDSVDPSCSRVVFMENKPVGAALIARRGWNCRLAGMALIPSARGRGVGRWLLAELAKEARARGDRRIELEVIEQNTAAVNLYKNGKFRVVRRLIGFHTNNPPGRPHPLEEIDLRSLGRLVSTHGLADLPWQISGESVSQLGAPFRAYQLENAYIALSNPNDEDIAIRTLLTLPGDAQQNRAKGLLEALFAKFPQKSWRVPAIFPEEFETLFIQAGFETTEISQFQMVLPL